MLSLDTAYRSFGGEVEASSTPTICRLSDSRRHQLWAIAPISTWITEIWNSGTWLILPFFATSTLLLTFGSVANEAPDGTTLAFDRSVMFVFRTSSNNFSTPIGPAWVQEMARDVTSLGSFAVLSLVIIVGAGFLLVKRDWNSALFVVLSFLGGTIFNTLLKFGFARSRPDFFAPAARVFTASFPSDHAAISAVCYMVLAAVLGQKAGTRFLQNYSMGVAMLLTLLVGVSRIYLGVHYPTDILAGWCVGSAWVIFCWTIMDRSADRPAPADV
jgi:undecaprenyl-diphosphatase